MTRLWPMTSLRPTMRRRCRAAFETLLTAAAGVCALALAGCSSGAAPTLGDYPAYESVQDAAHKADLVVAATVTDSRDGVLEGTTNDSDDPRLNPQAGAEEPRTNSSGLATTVSTVEVTDVLSGDVAVGDTLEVSQMGGWLDDTHYVEDDTTLLPDLDADAVVLFLSAWNDAPYTLINPTQGLYTLADDGTVTAVSDEGFKIGSLQGLASALDDLDKDD